MPEKMAVRSTLIALVLALSLSARAVADSPRSIEIPAGELRPALLKISAEFGADLVYRPEQIQGLRTEGARGTFTTEQAILEVLQGTPLKVSTDPSGAILISLPPAPTARNESTEEPAAVAVSTKAAAIGGRVVEQTSGSSLPGALVRIEGTDYIARTDGQGRFRFPGLPPGEYVVSISYLGFDPIQSTVVTESGETSPYEFRMGRAAESLEEIVVFGSRSARAKALNAQRTAENSSFVISSDTLGNFSSTTVSEALRKAPGVAFQRDRRTGDGANIILRGLAPEMNAVELNGVNLPIGSGLGRSPSLNGLLADSIETITVHQSLLPSMGSSGSGGLVEIETKSPLQRDRRFLSFGLEGGRAAQGGFADDLLATGTVSGIFGSEANFGLSASVQYREQQVRQFNYDTSVMFGRYLPLERDGSLNIIGRDDVDPRTQFPFEPGAQGAFPNGLSLGISESEIETLAMTVSSEWRVAEHTSLRLDLQRAESDGTLFTRNSDLSLGSFYEPLPVVALGGESRRALNWTGYANVGTSYTLGDTQDVTDTATLRGSTQLGKWTHDYTLGIARGKSGAPGSLTFATGYHSLVDGQLDSSLVRPEAFDPVENRIISVFGERNGSRLQLPLLTEAGWAFLNDPANQAYLFAQLASTVGDNDRDTAEWSTRYAHGGRFLKYVEIGANFERADFSAQTISGAWNVRPCEPGIDPGCDFPTAPEISAADLALRFRNPGIGLLGFEDPGLQVVAREDVLDFFHRLPELSASGPLQFEAFDQDPRLLEASTREDSLATYLQARIDIGKLEIVGGARVNQTKVNAFNLYSPRVTLPDFSDDPQIPAQFSQLANESETATDVMPRVQLNYRQSDKLIFRGSYYLAVARPAIRDLSLQKEITLDLTRTWGANFDQEALLISTGNPGLEPAVTHSFDIGAEYYSNQIGLMRLVAFYKHIDNLLESNSIDNVDLDLDALGLPDHPYFTELLADPERRANLFVSVSQPVNSPWTASIWGAEAHVERQLEFLPGFWSGFGVYGNLTYTKSSKRQLYTWSNSPVFDADGNFSHREPLEIVLPSISFNEQPKLSGTFAVTYNKHDIDATLTYSEQSRRKANFAAHGLAPFSEADSSLDLRIARRFAIWSGDFQVYLEGSDLLRGGSDPDLLTAVGSDDRSAYTLGGVYLGGRRLKLGMMMSY